MRCLRSAQPRSRGLCHRILRFTSRHHLTAKMRRSRRDTNDGLDSNERIEDGLLAFPRALTLSKPSTPRDPELESRLLAFARALTLSKQLGVPVVLFLLFAAAQQEGEFVLLATGFVIHLCLLCESS